jgi:acyl-CoA reductase-like NAD-dependent aldehyde dehydrogenase
MPALVPFAAGHELGAAVQRVCDMPLDLGEGLVVDQRADADIGLRACADLERVHPFGQAAKKLVVHRVLHEDAIRGDARLSRVAVLAEHGARHGLVEIGVLEDDERSVAAELERHVADALDGGAELVTGGYRHERGHTFFEPTVLSGVTASMAMTSEETFGPVAGVGRFATEREAIEVANSTPYGLAAYFYSRDVGRIWRVSEALEYGVVGINTGFISTEVAPFGGMKESGIGREGSKYGLEEWLELKYLAMGGVDR